MGGTVWDMILTTKYNNVVLKLFKNFILLGYVVSTFIFKNMKNVISVSKHD